MLGFALAGGLSAGVVAETLPTTTGTTSTETTTTATTTTSVTTTTPAAPTIPAGVRIAGVDVGGYPSEIAYQLLQSSFQQPLVVRLGKREITVSPRKLGATAYIRGAVARARAAAPGSKIDLVVTVRGDAVRSFVAGLASRFDRRPVDARLRLRAGKPFISEDVPGRRVDRPAAVAAIVRALHTNARRPLELEVRYRPAEVTRDGFGPVIVIHRGGKTLELFDGVKHRRTFGVATGQAAYPTPLGRFDIVVKWRNPWWYPPSSDWARGLSPIPPGPGNPLGTRWMGLSAPGVGIHGTPDSASIGYSRSHGCIRMRIPEAEWLFDHVEIGTTVFVVPL